MLYWLKHGFVCDNLQLGTFPLSVQVQIDLEARPRDPQRVGGGQDNLPQSRLLVAFWQQCNLRPSLWLHARSVLHTSANQGAVS